MDVEIPQNPNCYFQFCFTKKDPTDQKQAGYPTTQCNSFHEYNLTALWQDVQVIPPPVFYHFRLNPVLVQGPFVNIAVMIQFTSSFLWINFVLSWESLEIQYLSQPDPFFCLSLCKIGLILHLLLLDLFSLFTVLQMVGGV